MDNVLFPTVGIAGIGLIGGSLAKDLRTFGLTNRLIGWNRTAAHAERALELGLVDDLAPSLEALVAACDLTVLAMPVDVLVRLLPGLLSTLRPGQVLIDVGSTKQAIAQAAANHPNRRQFVACHPMAGTEKSGPDAAIDNLFRNRFTLLIDPEASDPEALARVSAMWQRIGAVLATLSAEAHDRTAALLSHMPHVLAYALARTIKEAERNQALNARFAGGGLASMTRIAHSPITMWQPIFRQNREALLTAIDAFSAHLAAFRKAIAEGDDNALVELMR
ncbi:MAG: prephenate dehydrogenase/arogenate dehydrogenase family protein [Lentisphaeraceae bacterium]|nr:prephenate dehydrogenase/arogenate dehydrogenase family protein [Lentisphaeraceae bacterium]